MFNGNKYLIESEKEGIPYPNWAQVAKSIPQIVMVERTPRNGVKVGKFRKAPYVDKSFTRGEGRWRKAFEQQAVIRVIIQRREADNMLPELRITCDGFDAVIKGDLLEVFLMGSAIADLVANGWEVTAP